MFSPTAHHRERVPRMELWHPRPHPGSGAPPYPVGRNDLLTLPRASIEIQLTQGGEVLGGDN